MSRFALTIAVLAPLLVFAGVAAFFLWGLDEGRNPHELPSALIDKPAPDFELPALDGSERPGLARGDLAGGVSLVNFFASWCLPCRAEHPLLMELAERGATVHGVLYKDSPEKGLAFLEELGNPYQRIGVDQSGRTSIDFGVYGLPETFVIDAAGHIRYRHVGPLLPEDVEEKILPLLTELER